MNSRMNAQWLMTLLMGLVLSITACNPIKPNEESNQTYRLDAPLPPPSLAQTLLKIPSAPLLQLSPIQTWAGLETSAIRLIQQPHQMGQYAFSQWIAPPAELLLPLIAHHLEQTQKFADITLTPNPAAQYRLELTLEAMHHNFTTQPSQFEWQLSAKLFTLPESRLLAKQRFALSQPAPTADAYGGVIAANQSLPTLLSQLTTFVIQALP